jgi:acyl-CoA reductase-like NAD-dependent aldehyde dehydrogenase
MQTYKLYINGEWVDTAERYEVRNPANGEVIAECAVAGEAELNAAVDAAERAFPDWATRSYEERGELLRAVAQGIKARYEEFALAETQQTGRCLRETMAHDIPATIAVFEYFAGVAPATHGETIPIPGMYLNYTRREPYGVVGAITPWNFPLWLAAIKIAPALAVGNTMVLKPAPTTPITALMLAEVMHHAGVPAGVFNVLTDPTPATLGDLLTRHPKVRKVSFTGSTAVGVRVMQNAATHIAPVSLELGGKSPFLVFADADFDRALAHALLANYFAQGQMCTAATRIFVERPIYERFRDAFVARAQRLQIGDPSDPTTEFATLHKREQLEKTEFYVRTALEEGAKLPQGADASPSRRWTKASTSRRPCWKRCSPPCASPATRFSDPSRC